jgi:anaerobic selenocysteine-containing dehydrogenase
VDLLVQNLSARVIVLPEEGNLGGVLLNGYPSNPVPDRQNLEVLYLIGQPIPLLPSSQPFILYQNMYPPVGEPMADLLLPTTTFTEENGTYVDYAGCVQTIHPAVKPLGEALPSWMILSRIAHQMGMQGFDYTCVEDIQAEIPGLTDALQGDRPINRQGFTTIGERSAHTGAISQPQLNPAGEHSYMGFPLAHWVDGLRMLYSEETTRRVHESNP